MSTSLEQAILGHDSEPTPHEAGSVVEGVVRAVTAEGLTFTVPTWDDGKFVFGPAPWPMSRIEPDHSPAVLAGPTAVGDHGMHDHGPHVHANHDHGETKPVKGDRCLVVFVGGGVENPWVVAWWPK